MRARTSGAARRYNEALGRKIAGARQASGMKCAELAAAAEITPGALYNYETGRTTCPPLVLARMARALKMPVGALMPKFALAVPVENATPGKLNSTPI